MIICESVIMQTKNLELIKQKIIKTDEVLKIYVEKRNELNEQSTKYQILLNKYRDKCKEVEKLKTENNKYLFDYDQYKKAIHFERLYNEISKSYNDLEKTYSQHVNNSEIKYQKVNQELQDSASKQILQSKTIEHLQKTIKELESKITKKSFEKIEEKTKCLEKDNINLNKCINKLELEKEELNGKITDLMLEINLLKHSDRFAPKENQERSTQTETIAADDLETDNFFVNYFFNTVTNIPKLLSPLVTSSDTNEDADFNTCSPLFEDTHLGNEIFSEHTPELSDEISWDDEYVDNEPNDTQIMDTANDENSNKNISEVSDFCHNAIETCNFNSVVVCNNTDNEITEHFDEDTSIQNIEKDDLSESINLNSEKTENLCVRDTKQNTAEICNKCDVDETTKIGEVNKKEELNSQDILCSEICNIKQREENIETENISFPPNENCPEFIKYENNGVNESNLIAKTTNLNTCIETKVDEIIGESDNIDNDVIQSLIDEMKFTKPMLSPLSSESEEELETNASFLSDHNYSKVNDGILLQDKVVLVGDNCIKTTGNDVSEIVCNKEEHTCTSQEILIDNGNIDDNFATSVEDNIDIMSLPIIFVNNLQDITELENCVLNDKSCITSVNTDSITESCENNMVSNNNKCIEETNKIKSTNNNENASRIQENEILKFENRPPNNVVNLNNEQIMQEKSTEKEIIPIKRKLPQTKHKANKKQKNVKNDSKNLVNNINVRKQISILFTQLLNFTCEPLIAIETANKLKEFDQQLILDEIFLTLRNDYFDKLNMKYTPPAPPLTVTQQVILGLMLKLVKLKMSDILDTFLTRAELIILTEKQIQCFIPVTRMYVAICKIQQNLQRIRRLCFDALYFMGDLVVPFLFCVLTSWTEVLPTENFAIGNILIKVLIQVVNLKICNKPGYNLLNLRNFLNGYYKYPQERRNSDEIITELVQQFKVNPTKELEYGILILCKNSPTKWVCEQIEKHLKPFIHDNNSSKIIELISKIMLQFNKDKDHCFRDSIIS